MKHAISNWAKVRRNPAASRDRQGYGVLYLVIGIPLAAVLMGVLTLYLAFSNADPGVDLEQPAMSKTSWRSTP